MSQLQEHFVQHRTSTMAQAMSEIKLGEQPSESGGGGSGGTQSFYS